VFVPARPFQPSPLFVSEVRAYASEAPETLSKAPGLTHEHYTRPEKSASGKHSGLLPTLINYG
jgi:hypothetical protein